ncbi:putative GTPase, partial [Snodgrassella alvi SCGC AB-598-O11]
QAFGLHHLSVSNLLHYFPDMRQYIGECRFHNCTHRQEPGCALKQAAADGKLKPERLQFLQSITDELIR